jgi:hypothetical protein
MKSGKRKTPFESGQWVAHKGIGGAYLVDECRWQQYQGEAGYWIFTFRGHHDDTFRCSDFRKLPASPADMAKSHRLLMRWWQEVEMPAAVGRHCTRLTTKQSRRAGKGK